MSTFKNLDNGDKILYASGYYSGNYEQDLYLKKANNDSSNRAKYYISVYSTIDGQLRQQGYIYFYLDEKTKSSSFIGIKVEEEYRNLNIASFLVASWIDFCLNNSFDFLGVNPKQKKPFLIYLLKTYGFEILDKSLYDIRPDVISICRSLDKNDKRKFLVFREPKHEQRFKETKIFLSDNYVIAPNKDKLIFLDNIIMPLQSRKRNQVDYQLVNQDIAVEKTEEVINRHKK